MNINLNVELVEDSSSNYRRLVSSTIETKLILNERLEAYLIGLAIVYLHTSGFDGNSEVYR